MSERISERNGLYVTSFAGGKRGLCLAFDTAHQVAELTACDVAALVDELTRWLDRTPYHRAGHDRRALNDALDKYISAGPGKPPQ